MKWLCAGLTFVNFATLFGLILGITGRGLDESAAVCAFLLGILAAVPAYFLTREVLAESPVPAPDQKEESRNRAGKTAKRSRFQSLPQTSPWRRYRDLWKWLMAACFAIFAFRCFLWLVYIDGDQLKIQSPNNLGDLALHITFIKNFANGAPLWPGNPIFVGTKIRYPAGTDVFNALLCLLHVDLIRGLVWAGLLGSLATFYAFYRWGGTFGAAGFLFNGGVVGFDILGTGKFRDYQGTSHIAWKSIPLSMFVTQRGLLYAIPAGLLLLWHWRQMYRASAASRSGKENEENAQESGAPWVRGPLPFWIELSLYASMPLFHMHTFLALSAVLVFLFLCGDSSIRWRVALLIAGAFVPASLIVWMITDHFHASSMISWHPGWVLDDPDMGGNFFQFWLTNFGFWVPLVLGLLVWTGWKIYRSGAKPKMAPFVAIGLGIAWLCILLAVVNGFHWGYLLFLLLALALLFWCGQQILRTGFGWQEKMAEDATFLMAALAIFVAGILFKFAPWGWDNLKLMMWSYFIVLPFLWNRLIAYWPAPVRVATCVLLFGSGFVTLFGGLGAGRPGYGFVDRAELDGVGHAVAGLPIEARFASYPTYNHPLLLQGRDVVLGYPGHLWTEGFDYGEVYQQLNQLMQGADDWREIAAHLGVRYIFWGPDEVMNYPGSKRPWEKTAALVTSGSWGAIYDTEKVRSPPAAP